MTDGVIWPPLMLLSAFVAATWLAYGIDPNVASQYGGLALITLTRRLQWILILCSVLPCLVLIARVSMARTRAWWLIGLSIVVALMFVRFSKESARPVRVVDAAMLPTLTDIQSDSDDEFVVGFELQGNAYAFPYRALYRTPIVQLTDFDQRVILMFSPYANSATALEVTHEIKADDMEYVSSPDNSTLAYNRKYGQFIVGVTGLTDEGAKSIGVKEMLPVDRVPLRTWRRWHPTSKIMLSNRGDADVPGLPLLPRYPIKLADHSIPDEQPITLLHTESPAAVLGGHDIAQPTPVMAGKTPLVLWRVDGRLVAFMRTVGQDVLTFGIKKDPKGNPQIVDRKTGSTWLVDGSCTLGPLKGKHLTPVRVEEDLYWGVCKTWWPALQVAHADAEK